MCAVAPLFLRHKFFMVSFRRECYAFSLSFFSVLDTQAHPNARFFLLTPCFQQLVALHLRPDTLSYKLAPFARYEKGMSIFVVLRSNSIKTLSYRRERKELLATKISIEK